MGILFKFLFYLKKPKLVVVFDDDAKTAQTIYNLIKQEVKSEEVSSFIGGLRILDKEVLIIDSKERAVDLDFLTKESSGVFIVLGKEIDKSSIRRIKKLSSIAGRKMILIGELFSVNQVEIAKNLIYSVGFEKNCDFYITDLNITNATNFKINYEGDIVPFWLKEKLKRKDIITISFAVAVATLLGINLVKISQKIKGI